MSTQSFSTMQEPDLLLASVRPEMYLSERDTRRLLAELESRQRQGGVFLKAIRRVKRSIAKAERK